MSPTLRAAAGSDLGQRRSMNQDSAYASSRMLAVADGMGGHAFGEVASTVAVRVMAALDAELASIDLDELDLLDVLARSVSEAGRQLTALAEENQALRGTGTTLVVVIVAGLRIYAAHIGDSRVYLLHQGELKRLTRDHTLVQALVDEGSISPEEAADHPRRSVLVRTLQDGSPPDPDLFEIQCHIGDRLLLCSDGVTAVLDDQAIQQVLTDNADPQDAVQRFIELANARGGPDNITAVVADVVEPEAASAEPVVVGAAAEYS